MSKKIGIYLAGSIKKGHEKQDDTFWTEEDMALIREHVHNEVLFLNPAFRTDDLSDSYSVFGRDMLQVYSSDFVFVDARDRRGLGVGAEMMWAKVNKIPVITWAPLNTHYKKDKATLLGVEVADFIHPFVYSLSDKIVENLIEGANWINSHEVKNVNCKCIDSIKQAMEYYTINQLDRDLPMKNLLTECNKLKAKIG